tara:strand:- start:140 stop:535 length:396 start_codon:yes stop_codon:yes gene_type:complete
MQIINFNQKVNSFLKNNSQYHNGNNKVLSNKNTIYFSKYELTVILNLYSKQVSLGSWRDYAIDSKSDIAVFSIYRHTHDQPMYQVIKTSKKGCRNNPNFFIKDSNKIIYKSKVLEQILSKFEKKINIKKQN